MNPVKKRLLIPGILAGVIILVLAILLKSSPEVQPNFDKARLVEVQSLVLTESAPEVIAYGRVAPKHSWQAIAEVSGKVIYRHPDLESGRLLTAGTLVLQIDPLEYQLKHAQALANVNIANAQLMQIEQQQKNLTDSLNIEKQKLSLVNQEYQRKLELQKKNLISNSEVESQNQTLLGQTKLVQDLSSSLKLLPDDKKVAQAQLNINQALLEDAQRQLKNTNIVLPFDARIAAVDIEQAQAVTIGNTMFEAQQLGTVEIKAELSLKDAESLMLSVQQDKTSNGDFPNIEKLKLNANIELQMGNRLNQWPATLTRIADNISPEQATIGFYLEVKQNIKALDLTDKPPLTKGMFVTARLQGFQSQQFIIPEKALHGDQIYIMDSDNNLSIRKVNIHFRSKHGVAISGDFKAQERLILNDIIPAIPGMALKTQGSAEESANKEQPKHGDKK
ncbi:HlyD family secretion protein [Psychromonas sp. psych-6C06]|uniref:efflux RND transporter periplasmic adaptor subunit n=1 Tax=Psychromonas sp. psych-6C06 TaxID=2058089 RepID=UPI000C33B8F7|nr:HlyD family secretion protein [Psychromonas sp. psych-6C06]PKF63110.1 HlyD family secretion protein [Psychromonas sp. psych-6C06]